jgi:PAS domain S-box-containing protein
MKAVTKEERRVAYPLVLIFAILSLGIVVGGIIYYRNYEQQFRTEVERQLSAIAELKAGELAQYRKERLGDAATFFQNAAFSGLVRRFFDHPEDADAQEQLQTWLDKYQTDYDRVFLLDTQGVERMSTPVTAVPDSAVVSRLVAEVLQSRKIAFQDFHRNEHNQRIYLTLLVPILDGPDYSRALGVLALRVDTATYLYPFISRWPTPSRTAETLLVRRDGNDVLFLNELKFGTNTALNLRISIENTNVPAVKAVLGQKGIVEGADYRGVPVLAALRAIPDSPWFLVARMDIAEVYAPLRERLWLTVLLVGVLLAGAGAGTGAIWRHRRAQFYKERSKVAEALRESEERFRRVFEEGPIGMAMLDETFRFIQVNPAFSSMLGYSMEELRTMTFTDITHPDHIQRDVENMRRLLRGELSVYRTEKRYVAKSKKELWGLVQVSVVRNATGAFRYFLAIISDITERKRAEVALRESEERLRFHTDNSPMAVVEWNADLIITRWTGAAEKMFGWNAEEAIGKPITELPGICEEDLPIVQSVIRQLADGVSKHIVSSNRNRTRNGQVIHCEWYSSVLHDAGRKIISVLSQILDITERKRAEETIARERQLLRTLIDLLHETFYVKDLDSRFLVVNETLTKQYGKDTPSQLLGLSDADLYPAGLAAEFRAEEMKVFAGEPIIAHEDSMVFLDGRTHTVLTTKLPFRDGQGRVCGLVGIGQDITERKRAEDELRRTNTFLDSIIENLPNMMFLKDAKTLRFVRFNRAGVNLLGCSEDDLLGKTDYDFFQKKELADYFTEQDRQVLRGKEVVDIPEEPLQTRDKGERILHTRKVPILNANGEPEYLLGISEDITERKRAEVALRESEALYYSLVEQLPAGVFRKDKEGRYAFVNPWLCRFRGVKAEHFLGKTPREIEADELAGMGADSGAHPRLGAQGDSHHKLIMQTGQRIEVEEEWPGVDGKKHQLHVVKSPVFDLDGTIVGTQGIMFDVTERKRAEEAFRESQALYHSLVEQLPVGVFRKDPAGRYVLVNPWFCRLKGMKAEEFLGKTSDEVAAGEVAKQDPTGRAVKYAAVGGGHHEQIMQTGKSIELVEEYTDADGRKQFVHAVKLPVFDLGGKVIGTQGLLFDITEIKQASEALHHEQTLMATLMKNLPDVIYFKDATSRFLRVNPAMARRFGLSDPTQAVGKTDTDFYTEEHASKALADEQEIIRTGQPLVNVEEKETWPDGSETWVLTTKLPLRDDAGRIIGTCGISSNITDRKRAEETLRRNEERLLKVVTQTRCILNSGQVEGPEDWRERALNPESPFHWDLTVQNEETAQKILPLELAPGERYEHAWIRSRNHADHTQMNWNSGNAFLNDLPFYRNEFRCIDKHGVGHWMQEFVTVRKLAKNRWEVFCITIDISDLKRIETELRESQALYYSLVDQMPAGIFRKDAEGRYVFVNSSFCRLKDMTPDQFLGKTALELGLTDVALAGQGANHHATIMQSGNQIEDDEVYSRADGETRNYHVVKSPILDSAGKIVGTQGVLFDITERKRAEEALQWSETQLHVILEATADGILAVDSKGKVIEANQRFAELWRIPQSLMDAGDERALLDLVLEQLSNPDAFLKKEQSLYNTDATDMDTLAFKDGRIFERYYFPMMMDGAVIGRVWSFRDITGRKRQEKELSEKNTELERFTYTVSHDLKSPLVTVKTFLGYLEQDLVRRDKERVKQDVAYMHTAADKMGQLLDELLNLARVGRKMNPAERVTFKELAQEVVRLVAGRISTGGAEVQVADAVVVLEGDRPRLMEIWQNLVENACKFMGNQPKPRVEIGVEKRGSETVFFVRDNGAGIDPRFQAKVFGLFEKLDPKGEGTGMGLALVKRIVEIYKGRIWVESPGLGQGANFLFTLPGAVIIDPEQSS